MRAERDELAAQLRAAERERDLAQRALVDKAAAIEAMTRLQVCAPPPPSPGAGA